MRGIWGGAIFMALMFTYNFGLRYGPLFLVSPLVLPYVVLPGGVVGLVLWFWTGRVDYVLGAPLRITIGSVVVFVIVVFFVIYQVATNPFTQIDHTGTKVMQEIPWISVVSTAIGGLAGLLCPSKRLFTKASKVTFRERMLLYKKAESQAKQNREKSQAQIQNRDHL
jgi:hypothetical protein